MYLLPDSFSGLYRDWHGSTAVLTLAILLALHAIKLAVSPFFFPWFLSRFSASYNRIMGGLKGELFGELQQQQRAPASGGEDKSHNTTATTEVNGDDPALIAGKDSSSSGGCGSLTILEIGVGTGANFQFYPDGAEVIAVEPNPYFAGYLADSVGGQTGRGVRLARTVVGRAEDLRGQVGEASVDAVVCTLVLCSVLDVDAVVREARRVLKPGGKFYFLEHVGAEPGSWVRTVQHLLEPLWTYFGDGCKLTRRPWLSIDRAGFSAVRHKRFSAPLRFALLKPHLMGVATK